jgi:Uncharacterized conserved protein
MTNRMLSLALIIGALVFVLLGGIFGVLLSRPVSAAQTGVNGSRQITVIGTGEVKATPDTANVQIGVQTNGASTQEALDANNAQMEAVIAKLKELGVDEKDLQTSGLSIFPRYNEDGSSINGYQVSNTLNVTIRNLAQAGDLLDKVVEAGANQVYGISLSVADTSSFEAQAREQALQAAKQKAEQLAQASGGSIGQVLVVTESIGSTPVLPIPYAAEMATGNAKLAVQPGEQTISLQVQVTYELR